MQRPNIAGKRLYDDLNPTFGLNKRGRSNSFNPRSSVQQNFQPRHSIYNARNNVPSNTTSSRQPPQPFASFDVNSFPFPPNVTSGPHSESPYFKNKKQPDQTYNDHPVPTQKQQNTTTVVQQFLPSAGVSKQKPQKGLHFLTGTVDKVLLWSKMIRNHRVLFEVYGICDYVRQGNQQSEKIFMMRDSNSSPVLQVVFYEIDRPLIPLEPGSIVKVQGVITNRSRFQAFNVQKSNCEEQNASQRIFYICDRAAHDLIN